MGGESHKLRHLRKQHLKGSARLSLAFPLTAGFWNLALVEEPNLEMTADKVSVINTSIIE